jgi:hypothetical protein
MEEKKSSLHGYNNSELTQRCEPTNHKIIYDGFHYRWKVLINGKLEIQSILLYDTAEKAYSHIVVWLSKYNKELTYRNTNSNKYYDYFDSIKAQAKTEEELYEISREYSAKTKEKINQMLSIKHDLSNSRISELLDVSIRSVERHRKLLNK